MKRKMGWAALMILSLLPGLAKADDTPMEAEAPIALTSPSAILCEASTGRVIFEKNADERRPVASVNKVMTILLTLEALDEDGRITGLSKIARLVDVYAKRPQVQERLTTQVADAMVRVLEPRGVIVVIECEHLCMSMRGVRKPGARTVTSAVRGSLREVATRAEVLSLISKG